MARKDQQNSFDVPNFDVQGDIRTDYVLIAAGIGAALAAFAYLLLT